MSVHINVVHTCIFMDVMFANINDYSIPNLNKSDLYFNFFTEKKNPKIVWNQLIVSVININLIR
jgi:hypothetical protein